MFDPLLAFDVPPPFRIGGLELDVSEFVLVVGGMALVLLAILIGLIYIALSSRQRTTDEDRPTDQPIDLSTLDHSPPRLEGPQLEFYGTPVRIMLLVIAPVGRSGVAPVKKELPRIAEYLLPGLTSILEAHQPRYERWSRQMSTPGFIQSFFNKVALPGDHGKGSLLCSIAGRFEAFGQPYLAGIVCCAATPNGLGEVTIDHPGQWLSVLRVQTRTT